ncbi:MAG: hypothetical protein IPI50_01925 [Saprospiraceae bacterium]|nr:hypothetical protein [Saprospiraceae bacterium]
MEDKAVGRFRKLVQLQIHCMLDFEIKKIFNHKDHKGGNFNHQVQGEESTARTQIRLRASPCPYPLVVGVFVANLRLDSQSYTIL